MERQTSGEITSQKLLKIIQRDGYTAGDKLPMEAELVEPPGVDRNTVREALRILMSRNIVTIRQGSGTSISDKNDVPGDLLGLTMIKNRRKLIEDLIQVRVVLGPPITALVTQNATVEDIRQLGNILPDLEEQMILREDCADEDSQFHAQVADCSHNLVIANLIPVITGGVRVFASTVQETKYEQTLKSHHRIFEAIQDRKPVEAQQTMYFHLVYNDNRYKGKMGDGKQGMKGTRAEEQQWLATRRLLRKWVNNSLLEQQLLFCTKNKKKGAVSSIFISGHTFCIYLQMFSDKDNFCGEIKKGNIHPIDSCVLFGFILITLYKYSKNKIYS